MEEFAMQGTHHHVVIQTEINDVTGVVNAIAINCTSEEHYWTIGNGPPLMFMGNTYTLGMYDPTVSLCWFEFDSFNWV